MPLSPAQHESSGKAEESQSHPDPADIERFTDLTRKLFGIERVEFEKEVERDKAERSAARKAKRGRPKDDPEG